jgi:hypothetical protein
MRFYIKEKNEDFMTLLSGVVGQKEKNMHIGDVLNTEIDKIKKNLITKQANISLAQVIDDSILSNYKLWPTNYIA